MFRAEESIVNDMTVTGPNKVDLCLHRLLMPIRGINSAQQRLVAAKDNKYSTLITTAGTTITLDQRGSAECRNVKVLGET